MTIDKLRKKNIMKAFITALTIALAACSACAKDYHVAKTGIDGNPGTEVKPFKTISAAADVAQAGDTITVYEGVYRERINPPRGGTSDKKRITYQAAAGQKVVIKGSEIIKGWKKIEDDTWKAVIPNSFFGDFNPFNDLISGDWFRDKDREHHTGAVYLNGHWLIESAKHDDVLKPAGEDPLWFGKVDDTNTTIWAQFKDVDPNKELVEINVRKSVFYPEKPGINYITIRGFTLEHAATPWAPPTAEQIGLIGTHWSKGWIIEDNVIRYSTCVGVTLGKYGDEFDNKAESAFGYNQTIKRALENGWTKEKIGSHIVRNNHISHCEQAGIVGSMGAVFSTIADNEIHDIHVRQLFTGAEMAGIKIHAAIDMLISGNYIHHTVRGIWLDWMCQGTRVTGNLLHDSGPKPDLFVEVNHGPFLVDNNIFLSPYFLLDISGGGAYVHNLAAGYIHSGPNARTTPYHKAHSTEVVDLHNIPGGDDRIYNNMFVTENALGRFTTTAWPVTMAGNVIGGQIELIKKDDSVYLEITTDKEWAKESNLMVTSELLGKTMVSGLGFEDPDGKPYRIDTDYFGNKRNADSPYPGPFDTPKEEKQLIKVWPKK
jgi:alpha-N-arabinofuranosidase